MRTKNVVHAALYLVVVLAGGAAQYILLGPEFVAWVQVLVYIGAVIVLFLFGIMLTRAPMHPTESLDNDLRWPAAVVVALPRSACSPTLLVDAFDDDKIELDDARRDRQHRAGRRRDLPRPTSSRSRSSACCCSPRSIGAVVLARRD